MEVLHNTRVACYTNCNTEISGIDQVQLPQLLHHLRVVFDTRDDDGVGDAGVGVLCLVSSTHATSHALVVVAQVLQQFDALHVGVAGLVPVGHDSVPEVRVNHLLAVDIGSNRLEALPRPKCAVKVLGVGQVHECLHPLLALLLRLLQLQLDARC